MGNGKQGHHTVRHENNNTENVGGSETFRHVGNDANPDHDGGHMSLKAAEAGMLVRFCVDWLMRNGGPARFGLPIIQAGQSPLRYMIVMKQIKVLPTDAQYTEMMQAAQ
eukprot:8821663-Pyramimonas_sp.AAC.1